MKDYYFLGRRSLGRAVQEVNSHSSSQPQIQFKELEEPKTYCGTFEKNVEVKATIFECNSMHNFFFVTKYQLTRDHYELMKSALKIKHTRSKALIYQARPYTTDLDQIKLYYESKSRRMYRVKIIDLYPIVVYNQLVLYATIFLIDKGKYYDNVPFDKLYDTPQAARYLKDIEPELKPSRLYLREPFPLDYEDKEINDYFCQKVHNRRGREFIIKIIDFKEGIYHVDLLDEEKRSFIDHLRLKFRDKLAKLILAKKEEGFGLHSRYELSLMNEIYSLTLSSHGNSRKRNPTHYRDLSTYFRQRLNANMKNPKISHLMKSFLRVKILSWRDPWSFYVIPDDPDYINNHKEFEEELHANRAKSMYPDAEPDHGFKKGDLCFFRNYTDPNFGDWVRGVIVEAPTVSGSIILPQRSSEAIQMQFNEQEEFRGVLDKFVYRIESIDYGFNCVRSALSMRRVLDHDAFFCRGTWSLKCRLFGVNPLTSAVKFDDTPIFSQTCLAMIDSWMSQRIQDNGKHAYFYMLFRSDVNTIPKTWKSSQPSAEVTIFHRFEPPYSIGDCFAERKRKTRYDCLNTCLIDRGVASDFIHKLGKSSKVDLDHYIVNLLVPHDRI